MGLDAAFPDALHAAAVALGVEDGWLLATLFLESRLDPTAHRAGSNFYGLSQLNGSDVTKYSGLTPTAYLALPASGQLPTIAAWYQAVLSGMYCGTNRAIVPASPGVFYACNLAPCAVSSGAPATVLYASPSNAYTQNVGLDINHDGAITIGDLDAFLYALTTTGPESGTFKAVLSTLVNPTPPYALGAPADPTVSEAGIGRALQASLLGLALAGVAALGVAEWRRAMARGARGQRTARRVGTVATMNPIPARRREAYMALGAGLLGAAAVTYILTRSKLASASTTGAGRFGSAVLTAARADLGVRESGPNTSARVDTMLANVGQAPGVNWCAAAVSTWIDDAAAADSVSRPINGSASARAVGDQLNSGAPKTFWLDASELQANPSLLEPGMIVVWSRGVPGSRLGHIGVVSSVGGDGSFKSIEGNSGNAADGVYEWPHDVNSAALVGAGGWNDTAIYGTTVSGTANNTRVHQGAGYLADPTNVPLFDLPAPELEPAPVAALGAPLLKGLLNP